MTPSERVLRRMSIYWGVRPLKSLEHSTTDDICNAAIELASVKQYVETGRYCRSDGRDPVPECTKRKERREQHDADRDSGIKEKPGT